MDGTFQQIAPKFKDEAIAFLKKVGQFAASHVKTAASGFHGRSVHSLGNTVLLRSVRVRDLRCDSVFGKKFINKFVVVFFTYTHLCAHVVGCRPKMEKLDHRQLVVSIPRLSAPSCHLLS